MSRAWYIIHTYSGYENKIERVINQYLESGELDPSIVYGVKVPVEDVVEVRRDSKTGKEKKINRKNKLLPGYMLIELDLPDIGWKATTSAIRRISGVTGFVGTNPSERPRPIPPEEAMRILNPENVASEASAAVYYNVGDFVKILTGPFATFSGKVEEINAEKDKMRVSVQIFGRVTPLEVSIGEVEKMV